MVDKFEERKLAAKGKSAKDWHLKWQTSRHIATRISRVERDIEKQLSKVLRYIYSSAEPRNILRKTIKSVEKYLTKAEAKVAYWMQTRTNGKLRKTYGAKALDAARKSKYKCKQCGNGDVRTLQIDHHNGRSGDRNGWKLHCLCSNCHSIKSFNDGRRRDQLAREKNAKAR